MSYRIQFINKVVFIIIFIWSLIMFGAGFLSVLNNYNYADSLAENEALVSVKKDLAYRSWVASHGGVYVPVTKRTPPNPYLSHIKNRDVYTTVGQRLTLMNPAYTLSQMMNDYTELYGTKGHITSRILMNPKNKPDAWEEKVLEASEVTGEASSKKEFIDGEEYFRYLKPLVVQPTCLKCHAFQGYKVGDIRGGVSVSIPMKKFDAQALSNSYLDITVIFAVYLLGLMVILYGRQKSKELLESKIKDYEQHIFSLVNIIEKRDSYTAGHTQRVAKYSVLIAREMGFSEDKIDDLYRACMLHDIGKISTPDSILLKPGKLTALEYEIIKEHVVVSYELLNDVDIYKDIAEIIRHHHEHYDGSGYPQGLKGDEIPMMSQIMTVADAFDAMTTNRIYKSRKSVETALVELNELGSKQFHSEVVKAAVVALEDIDIEMNITQRPKSKIEKERFSYFYKDQVTGVYNKDYLEFVLAYNNVEEFNINCIYTVYLHDFNQYNKKNSWSEGDELLKNFAKVLEDINESDFIFRVYGDDFIILNKEHFELKDSIESLEKVLKGTGVTVTYEHFDMKAEGIHDIKDLEKRL
ncbi:MAG: DUF3365 domain-containing protein [Campylobacterota bacterium]|nr:DUF3365 domain-containing protein [Campylobacterota bacterium]